MYNYSSSPHVKESSRKKDSSTREFELIALVSHQIRSPLYTIRNAVTAMQQDCPDCTDQCRSFLAIIDRSTDRIVALTERFLRLMELEERRHAPRQMEKESAVDLCELIERTVASLREENELSAKRIEVEFFAGINPAMVRCDPLLLEQALANLIANALQYGHCQERQKQPTAIVKLSQQQEYFYVEVRDFGIGIPEEYQKLVFQPFYRAPSSTLVRQTGSGLGLSIAKTIIESHGGTIGLESGPQIGTRFWFILPNADALPPPDNN